MRAQVLRPLQQEKANTSSRRMNENVIPCFWLAKFMNQKMSGHALQRKRGALFERNIVRQRYQSVGSDQTCFSVGAWLACVSNAITGLYSLTAVADRFDDARSLKPRCKWYLSGIA